MYVVLNVMSWGITKGIVRKPKGAEREEHHGEAREAHSGEERVKGLVERQEVGPGTLEMAAEGNSVERKEMGEKEEDLKGKEEDLREKGEQGERGCLEESREEKGKEEDYRLQEL